MSSRKNIKVSEETHEALASEKHSHETWDGYLHRLANAETQYPGAYEEAKLSFKEFLNEGAGFGVDLLVEVTTSDEGWSIETKQVGETGYHVNDREGRATIVNHLKNGEKAELFLENGSEKFKVVPILTWRQDDIQNPVVAGVEFKEIERVEE